MAIRTMPEAAYLRECFDYDPETGVLRWRERPASHFTSPEATNQINSHFAGTVAGWSDKKTKRALVKLTDASGWAISRIIWKMMTGNEPPKVIDHKDRDASNNRWTNLRLASQAENCRNQRGRRPGKKGANQTKQGRWIARITVNWETIYLGTFETEDGAHAAYVAASIRLHGEFGCQESAPDHN